MDLIRRLPVYYYPFVFLVAVAAGLVGGGFGFLGQSLLYGGGECEFIGPPGIVRPGWLGVVPGAIFGVVVGAVFSLKQADYRGCESADWLINDFGVRAGCIGGVVCSTLVHISLMICCELLNFYPLMIGAVFGAIAGIGLGVGSGIVCVLVYRGGEG